MRVRWVIASNSPGMVLAPWVTKGRVGLKALPAFLHLETNLRRMESRVPMDLPVRKARKATRVPMVRREILAIQAMKSVIPAILEILAPLVLLDPMDRLASRILGSLATLAFPARPVSILKGRPARPPRNPAHLALRGFPASLVGLGFPAILGWMAT